MSLFTVGHSTHDPFVFKGILDEAGLDGILDVRSHPSSRWQWWRSGAVNEWLERGGFVYEHVPGLGGWDVRHADLLDWARPRGVDLAPYLKGHFPKQRIGVDSDFSFEDRPEWASKWTSQGLHDYAWFTAIEEFRATLQDVVSRFGAEDQPNMAMVCSEAMWWKCHRSMIADVLDYFGVRVQHVMPSGRRVRVTDHDSAPRIDRYPPEVVASWDLGEA